MSFARRPFKLTAAGVAMTASMATAVPVHAMTVNRTPAPASELDTLRAAEPRITSYDIDVTPRSGFGCWAHDYDGRIVDTGRVVTGSVVCSPNGNQLASYSGGGGSLNDGVIPTTADATHLFHNTGALATDGLPARPTITLHLDGRYLVDAVSLFGGDIGGNVSPGAITEVTVGIGPTAATVRTTAFGFVGATGTPLNDLVDLAGTPLAAIPTDTITLNGFQAAFCFGSFCFPLDQFDIAEISVSGRMARTAVSIDVRPGSVDNPIQTRSQGKVPVAILSTDAVDAVLDVDRTSVTFGRTGDEPSVDRCATVEDVDDDGRADLICFVEAARTRLGPADHVATLHARTVDGALLEGTDAVSVRS